jgi:hypothetical protein
MSKDEISVTITKLANKHGSLRNLALRLGYTASYLCLVRAGKRECSAELAKRLGFKRITTFRQTTGGHR